MFSIGIMQGRLSAPLSNTIQAFPVDTWREEFCLANQAGLACIEWIYEVSNSDKNPLNSLQGIQAIQALSKQWDVKIWSVCADYFMLEKLVELTGPNKKNIDHLSWLIDQVSVLGAHHIVLPFVDSSSLNQLAHWDDVIVTLRLMATYAQTKNVELQLETDLSSADFLKLLKMIGHPNMKVNYDIGNSASLGFDPNEEFAAYGHLLGSVHVKDRKLHGTTVALGTGAANFADCFYHIYKSGYQGYLILQAARSSTVSEVELAIQNRIFVEQCCLQNRVPEII